MPLIFPCVAKKEVWHACQILGKRGCVGQVLNTIGHSSAGIDNPKTIVGSPFPGHWAVYERLRIPLTSDGLLTFQSSHVLGNNVFGLLVQIA
jgi:hypothetical protein